MDRQRLKFLLEKVVKNMASPMEQIEFDAWYENQQKENSPLYADVFADEAIEVREELLQKISGQIKENHFHLQSARILHISRRFAVAASFLVIIVGAVLIYYYSWSGSQQKEGRISGNQFQVIDSLIRINNISVSVKDIHLPDGSDVILYPGSEISYQPQFNQVERRIVLSGKAFFQVAKNAGKHFIVTSNSISTTALGTSFTITSFKDADNVEIILHTGKVMVSRPSLPGIKNNQQIFMVPGEQVHWNLARNEMTVVNKLKKKAPLKPAIQNNNHPELRTGLTAEFNQEPLEQVLHKIEKGFGTKIIYQASELKDMYYTGRIKPADSLVNVLERIALLQDLELMYKNHQYLLRKQF